MAAHVLLVDDDPVQVAARQAILQQAGFAVSVSTNATAALAVLRSGLTAGKIDAVLTDHVMPGVNGDVFVRQLRAVDPHIPVLVITGAPDAEQEYAGLNVHFRNKPLPPPLLIAAVKAITQQ